jgi:hypothetical protein
VDRSRPPLQLSRFIQDVAPVTQPNPRTEESPESPAQEGMGALPLPSLVVPELQSTSGPDDLSLPFPEPLLDPSNGPLSPNNGNFVWDTLAPMFFNLHNPWGLITARREFPHSRMFYVAYYFIVAPGESCLLAESSASPVRIVLDRMTDTNTENLDDLGLAEGEYR